MARRNTRVLLTTDHETAGVKLRVIRYRKTALADYMTTDNGTMGYGLQDYGARRQRAEGEAARPQDHGQQEDQTTGSGNSDWDSAANRYSCRSVTEIIEQIKALPRTSGRKWQVVWKTTILDPESLKKAWRCGGWRCRLDTALRAKHIER